MVNPATGADAALSGGQAVVSEDSPETAATIKGGKNGSVHRNGAAREGNGSAHDNEHPSDEVGACSSPWLVNATQPTSRSPRMVNGCTKRSDGCALGPCCSSRV